MGLQSLTLPPQGTHQPFISFVVLFPGGVPWSVLTMLLIYIKLKVVDGKCKQEFKSQHDL